MAETRLEHLVANMSPEYCGDFAFCVCDKQTLASLPEMPLCTFIEREGLTIILPREAALRNGLNIRFDAAMITLNVFSDLYAVGLLAAVSSRLAEAGISTNVVSAVHHDHLFVPRETADRVLNILRTMMKENLPS